MSTSKNASLAVKFFLLLALSVLAFVACTSDLLSATPASVKVRLVSDPVATSTLTGTSLAFKTDQKVTVSVDYGTVSGTYPFSVPRSTTETTTHTVALTGLQSSTTYYYRIVSYLGTAKSFESSEYSLTTAVNPNILEIVTGPTVTFPSYTSVTIAWKSNLDCTQFVEYSTVSNVPGTCTVVSTVVNTNHSVTITGLSTATTYYYRIHMLWDDGEDFVSDELTTATSTEIAPTLAQKTRGIWLIGGIPSIAATSPIAEIDLYDPVLDTWYPAVTSIPSVSPFAPVSFAGYAAYNGELFIIGGFDSTGAVRNSVQIYTIATNTWRSGSTTLFTARANITASVLYGRIYVTNGTNGNNTAIWAVRADSFEYNIAGDSWLSRNFPTTGSDKFTVAFDNVIYHLGGRTSNILTTTAVDGLVYSTGTLTSVTEVVMGAARTGIAGAVYKPTTGAASIIVIGGITTIAAGTNCFINDGSTATQPTGGANGSVVYLPYPFVAPAAWIVGPSLSSVAPVSAFGAAVITSATGSARLYHFGGTPALGASGVAFGTTTVRWIPPPVVPNPWTDTWTSVTAMPVARPRWGHGAVTLSN